ncbi:MAG TPA: hypothetical protein VFW30_05340, partial [Bryocella sp.]|nr:hypothetical protein [Bryocella sp.]
MHPSLVSFSEYDAFESALKAQYELAIGPHASEDFATVAAAARALFETGLPPIASSTSFALILGVSPRLISTMAYF